MIIITLLIKAKSGNKKFVFGSVNREFLHELCYSYIEEYDTAIKDWGIFVCVKMNRTQDLSLNNSKVEKSVYKKCLFA